MHYATQRCKELDYFVMWSSLVASAGNEGMFQTSCTLPISLNVDCNAGKCESSKNQLIWSQSLNIHLPRACTYNNLSMYWSTF